VWECKESRQRREERDWEKGERKREKKVTADLL